MSADHPQKDAKGPRLAQRPPRLAAGELSMEEEVARDQAMPAPPTKRLQAQTKAPGAYPGG